MATFTTVNKKKEEELRRQMEERRRKREEEAARKKQEEEAAKQPESAVKKPEEKKPAAKPAQKTGAKQKDFTPTQQQMDRWNARGAELKKPLAAQYDQQRQRRIATGMYDGYAITTDDEGKTLSDDTINDTTAWLEVARKAAQSGSASEINYLLSNHEREGNSAGPDVYSARRGLYLSPLGSKEVSHIAKEVNALQKALEGRRAQLDAQEKGAAQYGSSDEYARRQELGLEGYIQDRNNYMESAEAEANAYEMALRKFKNTPTYWGDDPARQGLMQQLGGAQQRLGEMGIKLGSYDEMMEQAFLNNRAQQKGLRAAYDELGQTAEVQGFKGKTVNPKWEDNREKWLGIPVARQNMGGVQNKATFARDNKDIILANPSAVDEETLYMTRMDEDEVLMYTYLNDNYGEQSAHDYYASKEAELKQRNVDSLGEINPYYYENVLTDSQLEEAMQANKEKLEAKNKGYTWHEQKFVGESGAGYGTKPYEPTAFDTVMDTAYGVYGAAMGDIAAAADALGIDTAVSKEELSYANQKGREAISDKFGKWGEIPYDVVGQIGRMAMDSALGPVGAQALLATGAYDAAYNEGIEQHGMVPSQAGAYAAMVTGSELMLERLLSGITAVGKGVVPAAIAGKMPHVKNAIGRALLDTGYSAMSEATEEYTQSILEQAFLSLAKGKQLNLADIEYLDEEALYGALVGAITGGLMEAPVNVVNARNNRLEEDAPWVERKGRKKGEKTAKTEEVDLSQNEYTEEDAQTTPENTEGETQDAARKLAQEVAQQETAQETAQRRMEREDERSQADYEEAQQEAQEARSQRLMQLAEEADRQRMEREDERAQSDYAQAQAEQAAQQEAIAQGLSSEQQRQEQAFTKKKQLAAEMAEESARAQNEQLEALSQGLTENQKKSLKAGYNGNISPEQYVADFKGIMNQAEMGKSFEQIKAEVGAVVDEMGEDGARLAYYQGETARKTAQMEREQAEAATKAEVDQAEAMSEEAPEPVAPEQRKAGLNWAFKSTEKISKAQKAIYRVIDEIGKRFDLEIVLEKTIAEGRANGKYDPKEGKGNVIHIAADSSENGLLYVVTHELTHYVKSSNEGEYTFLKDYVLDRLGKAGTDVKARVREYMDKMGLDEDVATEEVVAEALPAIWNSEENVRDFVSQNRSLAEKVRDFLGQMVKTIKSQLKRLSQYHGRFELGALENDLEAQQTMYDMLTAALEGAKISRESGAQVQGEAVRYNPKITLADAKAIQQLPRGSVSQFNSEEIKKSANWAEKLYGDLVNKSPFFRAWFGDWRANDTKTDAVTVTVPNTNNNIKRETIKNTDTGWDIRISRDGIKNTNRHSGSEKLSVRALQAIKPILENGILLDTESHEPHRTNSENDQIGFDHKLYTPIEIDGELYIAKLTVEDAYLRRGESDMRFHNVKAIEIVPFEAKSLSEVKASAYTPDRPAGTIKSVADLYAAVKASDPDFQKTPADDRAKVDTTPSKVVDENGKPLVVYHGTDKEFNIFESADGTYWFSQSKDYAEEMAYERAGSYDKGRVGQFYLDIKNPYYAKLKPGQFSDPNYEKGLIRTAKNGGYDGLIIENDTDNEYAAETFYVAFNPTQIKNATDNIGTFDRNNPDIRYNLKDMDGVDPSQFEDLAHAADVEEHAQASDPERLSLELVEQLSEKSRDTIARMSDNNLRSLAEKTARKLVREYQSGYSVEEATEGIFGLYKAMGQNQGDGKGLIQLAADIGKTLVSESTDKTLWNQYKDFRTKLKNSKLRLSSTMIQEIENLYDNVEDWRKANFGKFTISKGGTPLDVVYQDLAEQYPELLPVDAHEAEMPMLLVDALESINPQPVKAQGMDVDSAGIYAGMEMLEGLFEEVQAGADINKLKNDLKRSIVARKNALKAEYDKALLQVKKDDVEKRQALAKRYKEALEDYNTTGSEAAKVTLAERMEQYKKLTNRRITLLQQTKARYNASQANAVKAQERRKASQYRASIEKTANELKAWLAKPTDKKHVPEFFRKQLSDVLTGIDLYPKNGTETKKATAWRDSVMALNRMITDMDKARTGDDMKLVQKYQDMLVDFDPELVANLQEIVKQLTEKGPVRLRNAEIDQLKTVRDLMRNLKQGITKMNKGHGEMRNKDINAVTSQLTEELQGKKDKKAHTKVGKGLDSFLNLHQLDAYRFAKRVGKGFESVIDNISKGKEKAYLKVGEASDYMKQVKKDLGVNGRTLRAWNHHLTTFKLKSGQSITLSTPQIMELKNLWARPQAAEHILTGGIKVEKYTDSRGVEHQEKRVNVTAEDVQGIIKTLTDTQVQFAEAMQRYMATDVAAWGNEASMELFGYEKYTEAAYWPIRSDKNYLKKTGEDNANALINAFINSGFTKAVQPGARNPITIGSAMETFTNHVGQVANYNGLAGPMQDLLRMYNHVEYTKDAEGKVIGYKTSVKEEITRTLGEGGKAYIEQLIKDINGQANGQMGADPGAWLLRHTKASAIAGNLRVVIQQPTSLFRALSVVDAKYLAAGTKAVGKMKKTINEMHEKSGIAYWKSQGHYDIGTGKSMTDIVIGDGEVVDNISNALSSLAGAADDATWAVIWEGCKAQVKGENPDIKVGSDAYWKAVNDLFSRTVNETQVVDSVLHRSQMMRNRSGIAQMATAFMSEPTKQYNMLQDAARALYNGEPDAKKKAVRAAVSVTASIVANRAAKALYDALTRRDEDDEVGEKILENFAGTPGEWALEFLSLPYFNDILNVIRGYDVERGDMSGIIDFMQAAKAAYKMITGESKENPYQVISGLVKAASAFTKLPLNGVLTSTERIVNAIAPGTLMWTQDGAADNMATLYGYILEGRTEDAKALISRIQEAVNEVDGTKYNKAGYAVKSNKEIDAAIGKLLAVGDEQRDIEPDKRIAKAWEAKGKADTKTVDKLKAEVVKDGFTGEMFDQAIKAYDSAQPKEKEEKDLGEELEVKLYQKQDMINAFDKAMKGGGTADLMRVADEIIADSDAENPISTAKTALTSSTEEIKGVKERYVEAYEKGDEATMRKMAGILTGTGWWDYKDLNDWVKEGVREDMYDAFEAGDIETARDRADELIETGFVEKKNDLLSAINSKYGPEYKDMYFSGDLEAAAELARKLQALGLTNDKGERAYTDGWIQSYWRSASAKKAWLKKREKSTDGDSLITGRKVS